MELPIPGKFTVYNALSVLGIARQLGISLADTAEALKTVQGVKGRMEVVPTPGKNYSVLIDYSHTPDALENVISSVQDFCQGRVIGANGAGKSTFLRILTGELDSTSGSIHIDPDKRVSVLKQNQNIQYLINIWY